MTKHRLIIGTRGSKLALTQSEMMAAALRDLHPGLTVDLQIITTKGDQVLDVALSAVGDKGLFVKELEVALLAGDVDLAVHSCKDLPSIVPDGLTLAAFPQRADAFDALVLPQSAARHAPVGDDPFALLPQGARVGTSSLRRACQLRALRPDLQLADVRGNVDTRLRKLDEGQYDALILAAAGLRRLGLGARISALIPPGAMLPAVTQGTLAIEARADDPATLTLLAPLDDARTRIAAETERAFLRRLEGGCQVPIAAYAQVEVQDGPSADWPVSLAGLVGSLDGTSIVRGSLTGSGADAEIIGVRLAEELLDAGAATILATIAAEAGSP